MNKTFTFLLGLLCPFVAFTQVTITSKTKMTLQTTNAISYLAGKDHLNNLDIESAEGYSWDFSEHSPSQTAKYYSYSDPSGTQYASDFQAATLAEAEFGGQNYTYYQPTDTALLLYGNIEGTFSDTVITTYPVPYKTPLELLQYPITYKDEQNSSTTYEYERVFKVGQGELRQQIYGSMTRKVTATGYGTLKLYSGKQIDVLRLFIEVDSRDSVVKSGNSSIQNGGARYYEFWSPSYTKPVITATLVSDTIYTVTWLDVENSTYLSSKKPEAPSFSAYPNPSQGIFNIPGNQEYTKVVVTDLAGREVYATNDQITQIDISYLENGTYVAQLFDNEETITVAKLILRK